MRRLFLPLLFFLNILLIPQAVFAVEVQGLYQAQVPVSSQQRDERVAALRTALENVLVKVSGQRSVARLESVRRALKLPSRFLQQYRYQILPPDPLLDRETTESRQVLWAQFDPVVVNKLLQGAGVTVWGRARPSVLVWLALEESGKRWLVGSEDDHHILEAMKTRATDRGVPLVFPLFDLQDQANLRLSDVWGGFNDNILLASRRYRSEVVLVVRAFRLLPNLWESRWSILVDGEVQRWATQDDLLDMAMDEGMDRALDLLALRFAQPTAVSETGPLELVIRKVNTLEDYAKVLRYLGSLDLVTDVRVLRVETGRVKFRLNSRTGREAIGQAMSLGRTLLPVETAEEWLFELLP